MWKTFFYIKRTDWQIIVIEQKLAKKKFSKDNTAGVFTPPDKKLLPCLNELFERSVPCFFNFSSEKTGWYLVSFSVILNALTTQTVFFTA